VVVDSSAFEGSVAGAVLDTPLTGRASIAVVTVLNLDVNVDCSAFV
jgi:hypothetical protein